MTTAAKPSRAERRPRGRRAAFTLMEAGVVMMIVGVGAVAFIELLAAGTVSNADATQRTTAINLAGNIREMALGLKFADPQSPGTWSNVEPVVELYDDIKDLDGQTFQPPLNGRRQPIEALSAWSQAVTVETVAQSNLSSVIAKDPLAPTARVTVRILRNGREVYRRQWLAVAPNPDWSLVSP
jgi:type II secretory pathway pseudopilin PulG